MLGTLHVAAEYDQSGALVEVGGDFELKNNDGDDIYFGCCEKQPVQSDARFFGSAKPSLKRSREHTGKQEKFEGKKTPAAESQG